jgi:hypothetical protein
LDSTIEEHPSYWLLGSFRKSPGGNFKRSDAKKGNGKAFVITPLL